MLFYTPHEFSLSNAYTSVAMGSKVSRVLQESFVVGNAPMEKDKEKEFKHLNCMTQIQVLIFDFWKMIYR